MTNDIEEISEPTTTPTTEVEFYSGNYSTREDIRICQSYLYYIAYDTIPLGRKKKLPKFWVKISQLFNDKRTIDSRISTLCKYKVSNN